MPTVRVPLVGVNDQRSINAGASIANALDQEFINCLFDLSKNPITGKATIHCEKRPGFNVFSMVESGSRSNGALYADSTGTVISAFGATNSNIYDGVTSVGAITGQALHFTETIISSIGYVMIKSSDGTGWYYASNSGSSLTYTGNTHTNTTIDNLVDTTGMYSGQLISGTGIVVGTRILSVDSAVAITTDTATTATNSGITITKTPIAKILDTDFIKTGSYISNFAPMDGYLFYTNQDAVVRNSDLNSVSAYTAGNSISANISPDAGVAIARYKNRIVAFQTGSMEVFYDAGNPSGSPLNSDPTQFKRIGCQDQRSVALLEDDLYFVSSSREGDVRIYRLRDFSLTPVSTPQIDRIIGTASSAGSNLYLSGFQLGGYSYVSCIGIAGPGSILLENNSNILQEDSTNILLENDEDTATAFDVNLFYNVDLNIFSEWSSTLANRIRGVGLSSNAQIIATSRIDTGGNVYGINPAADGVLYTDNGSAYTMTVRTSKIDFGTDKYKYISRITLLADKQSSGSVLLECSDDDYATWQTLGTFDLTQLNPFIPGCGSHQGGRAYRLTDSGNNPCRIEALIFEFTAGSF